MIHPGVKSALFADDDEERQFSFVVEWLEEPDFSSAQAASGKRERLEALTRAYDSLKEPLLAELRAEPGVAIQDLKGSSQVILSAPSQKWRDLVKEGGTLDTVDGVRVLPNELFYSQG